MLIKLLKYDLKYMTKNMGIFYALTMLFAITTRLFFAMNQTVIIAVIARVSMGCYISMLFSVLFNTVIRSWVRFKDSIYKDEGYLTHTLPVTKDEIYFARFWEMMIFTLVGFLGIGVSLFVAFYTESRMELVRNVMKSAFGSLEMSAAGFLVVCLAIFFLEIVNAVQAGFFGIINGFRQNTGKTLGSFLYGIVYYVVSQGFSVLFVFLAGLIDRRLLDVFTSTSGLSPDVIRLLMILCTIAYVLMLGIGAFICSKQLNKGVDLE